MENTNNYIWKYLYWFALVVTISISTLSIFSFYGIGFDVYGIYIIFYVFLLLCCLIFDRKFDDKYAITPQKISPSIPVIVSN